MNLESVSISSSYVVWAASRFTLDYVEKPARNGNSFAASLILSSFDKSESPDLIDLMIELECIQCLANFCDLSKPSECTEDLPKLILLLLRSSSVIWMDIAQSSITTFMLHCLFDCTSEEILRTIGSCLQILSSDSNASQTLFASSETLMKEIFLKFERNPPSSVVLKVLAQMFEMPLRRRTDSSPQNLFPKQLCQTICNKLRKDDEFQSMEPIASAMPFILPGTVLLSNLFYQFTNSLNSDFVIDNDLIPFAKQLIDTFCFVHSVDSTPLEQWHIKEILNICWDLVTCIVESAFDDIETMITLLVRTRRKFKDSEAMSDIAFLVQFVKRCGVVITPLLERRVLARIFSVQPPHTVPLSNALFHYHLISLITLFLHSHSKNGRHSKNKTSTSSLLVENVVEVAKSYLVFILPKVGCLGLDKGNKRRLAMTITELIQKLIGLEQYEAKQGRHLITEREVWEVTWMTEIEDEKTLGSRLEDMNKRDGTMRQKKKERWGHRRRKLGDRGLDDAIEAKMTTTEDPEDDNVLEAIYSMAKKEGMNYDFIDEDDSDSLIGFVRFVDFF
ncbi:hypothetical protein BLNAU_4815 [Blattamonas nauphoetae]|uniref:Uncharacterized protein n=1 Tax=Blattamonas nauphoetae TaxID=2049346 RepID=A0ABQ9Y955_9EUKA|nr:hypothetical protein BLNAU_4815 [Blattamonas nauphoetae]